MLMPTLTQLLESLDEQHIAATVDSIAAAFAQATGL